ncbi:MAG: hypothetical protein NVS3B17_04030 [Vulcanimicrobiaceae bacterium]
MTTSTCAIALAATISFAPLGARAQTLVPSDAATLAVAGNGLVRREPDEARADVGIVTTDDDAARSTGKNAAILAALKTKLAALGVAADAVGTTNFNVTFVPYPPKNLPPEQRQSRYGFVTTRDLTIRVAPTGIVGKVVDAATAAGVTQIEGVSFDLKDRKAAYREALVAALADARASATALAGSGDFRLVRIRRISTGGGFAPRPAPLARGAMMQASTPTELPPGPIEVGAHVDCIYEIRER